jgi:hypothetical protein
VEVTALPPVAALAKPQPESLIDIERFLVPQDGVSMFKLRLRMPFSAQTELIVNGAILRDFPIVQGVVFTMVLIVISLNLLADMLYRVADPRVT